MNIYIESMTKFVLQPKPWVHWTVRVWRQEEGHGPEASPNCEREALAAINVLPKDATQYGIAVAVLAVDRVNAVEVLDEKGNGPVIYKDWP